MDVFVEGIRISLTESQISIVEAEKRKREKCLNSFINILIHFGFKETIGKGTPSSVRWFENKRYNWYAELTIHNENWQSVWMVGKGLKQMSLFPGGWIYESPKEIENEILSFFAKNY
jgi:hypothetical protein